MLENLETLAQAVESAHANIAPEYQDYFMLANAIATDCGEAGRSVFHRLCRFSPKYRQQPADKIFDNMLRTNQGRVHLGTVYHLARQAGVRVEEGYKGTGVQPPLTRTRTRKEQDDEDTSGNDNTTELITGSEPTSPLPTFPEAQWPEPLATVLSYATSHQQRDALLLGALTVIGSTMEQYVKCQYGGKMLSPCLQTFVVAPPASGKGHLALLRHLVEPIHDAKRRNYEQKMRAYTKAKAEYDNSGKQKAEKEQPERPRNEMFLISGNNSGTGILQNIMDAGGVGLILETEADTISTAIGSDYGHWSDTLRKCFDHERLSYNRRMDQEYREVKKTYLSVLLSGTPAQVKPLIPSAENGLFSRQLFYYMPGIRQWQNQFDNDDTDLETVFTRLGNSWFDTLSRLKARGNHYLRLTPQQKDEFNRRFSLLFAHAGMANGNEMNSSVARLAINLLRIMSVVAVLRDEGRTPSPASPKENVDDGTVSSWHIAISDNDFSAVLSLLEPLYRHTIHILSFLPSSEVIRRTNSECENLFSSMPDTFTREAFLTQAAQNGIKENTSKVWLKRALKSGTIRRTDAKGVYTRVCV